MNEVLNGKKKKAKLKVIGQVYETFDYGVFKTLEGNRGVTKGHVKKLMQSMEEMYLISPIIVNDNYEIIDGQHRFDAAMALKLPIRFVIDSSADLRAVQLLNAKSKDWTPIDYMESYIKLGYKEYEKYKDFHKKYNLSHQICQTLLQGASYSGKIGESFNVGDFVITEQKFADRVGCFVLECLQYYSGSKRRSFVFSISTLMKNPKFKEKEFLRKLKSQRNKMYDCAKTTQYIELIEEIYNYRNKNKVNLRF